MSETATFLATLPPLLSAIRVSGDGGMRVMFDIPESDMAEALKLLLWKGTVLRLTVEPEPRPEYLTKLDNETEEGPEGSGPAVDSRRIEIRRDKRPGG